MDDAIDHDTDGAGGDEHPPPDLMAIYLACDAAPGDTDELITAFGQEYGSAQSPA